MAGSSGIRAQSRTPWLATLLRAAAGLALLAFLLALNRIDLRALGAAFGEPQFLVPAALCVLATIPAEALRWHLLLRAQGFELRLASTMRVIAIGLFFANFMPGAAGSDVVRCLYVYRIAKGRRAAAMLSILVDRVIGFFGYVVVGLVAIALRPGHDALEVLVMAGSAVVVAAFVGLLMGPRVGLWVCRRIARHNVPLARLVEATGEAVSQYARDGSCLAGTVFISIVVVALGVLPLVLLAEAMPFAGPDPLGYGIAALYAQLANSFPLTPGGLGLGETAFTAVAAMLAPQTASAAYGTIFLTFRCIVVVTSLVGLAAYLAGGLDGARDAVEGRCQIGADRGDCDDDGNRDEGGDEAVFNCGRAVFLRQQPQKFMNHGGSS